MKKTIFLISLLGSIAYSVKAQIVLEALDAPDVERCYSIPSHHPFHKVTRGNYKADGTFADPITGDGSVYMWWENAHRYNFPAGYHLPTQAEWRTIVPDNEVWNMGNNNTRLNLLESHQFGKEGLSTTYYKTFKGDYYKANDGTLYAIRFKPSDQNSGNFIANNNNDYTTAYRYRNLGDRVVVDINYIGSANVSVSNISNANYWEEASCKDAFVFLKKGFWYGDMGTIDDMWLEFTGGEAWYWTSNSLNGVGVWWGSSGGFGNGGSYKDTIRLFKD